MQDLEAKGLTAFQTAEDIVRQDAPLSAKLDHLFQIITERIGDYHYLLLLDTLLAEKLHILTDKEQLKNLGKNIVIAAVSLTGSIAEPKVFSEDENEIDSFFSGIEFSYPESTGYRFCAVVPFVLQDQMKGLVCMLKNSAFKDRELAEFNMFSAQIGNVLGIELIKSEKKGLDSSSHVENHTQALLHGDNQVPPADSEISLLKEYYETMVHTSEDMIFAVDLTGKFTFINRKGKEIMGDIVGTHFEHVVVPEHKRKVESEFERRKKGKKSPIYKIQVLNRDGERIWLEISTTPFFHRKNVVGVCGSARDITDKVQTEEQRDHLTTIANDILQRKDLDEIMNTVANAIHDHCNYGRVIISLLNTKFEATNLAFAGLTDEEKTQAYRSHFTPQQRKKIFSEEFRVGQSYYIPHDKTPWKKLGVESKVKPEQTKDWHPDDFLFIPLYGEKKRVIGLISVDDPLDGRAPTVQSLGPVELFATQAAIAIENARLYEKIRTHAEDLESKVEERTRKRGALLEINYRLRETTSWEKGMNIILEGITKGFGFENAELFLINEAKKVLENIAVIGAQKKEDIPLHDLGYVAAQCAAEKKPINIKNASKEVEKQIEPVLDAFAWIPIMSQDEILGVISVYNEKSKTPISDEELDDLLLFASQAAHFVESTRFLINPAVENSLDTEVKYKLETGESYLIEGKEPLEAFDIFLDAVTHGIQGFSICRTHPKKVRKKYGLKRTPILWLSTIETGNSVDPKDLAKINHLLNEFVKRASNSILLLEGIEYLIIQNNFEKVIKALHSLNDYVTINNSRLLVPVNPKTLEEKELSILEKEFKIFK